MGHPIVFGRRRVHQGVAGKESATKKAEQSAATKSHEVSQNKKHPKMLGCFLF